MILHPPISCIVDNCIPFELNLFNLFTIEGVLFNLLARRAYLSILLVIFSSKSKADSKALA